MANWNAATLVWEHKRRDASHYGLTIIVLNTVEVGEYHAKLAVWGANSPTRESEIEIIVLAP